MRRVVVLALLFGAMKLLEPLGRPDGAPEALLTFGFLILAAYAAGELAARFRQPKIIGYLTAGVLSGPTVLATVTTAAAAQLAPVSSLAIAMIAFLAGAELDIAAVRARAMVLIRLTVVELMVTTLAIFVVVIALRRWVPFLRDADPGALVLFGGLFALIAVMHSPAIVMALLTETGARGPGARTTLAVVVLSEVVVVLLFSALLGIGQQLLPGDSQPTGGALAVAWEIAGSVPIGAAIGYGLALALRVVRDDRLLFALLACLVGQQIAALLHVEVLLTLLTAGVVSVNFARGRDGEALREGVERAAGPIFVVFFALAGVAINVPETVRLAPVVVPIVLVRAGALLLGVRLGSRGTDVTATERRVVWQGLVAQAGVAIGLVTIVADAYPEVGPDMRALLLAVIAVNGTIGPILFRRSLAAAGELDPMHDAPDAEAAPGAVDAPEPAAG